MKFNKNAAKIRSGLYIAQYDFTIEFIEEQIKQASDFGAYSVYLPGHLPNEIWQELFEAGYGLFQHHAGTIIFWSE
jgi:hypothetical protein